MSHSSQVNLHIKKNWKKNHRHCSITSHRAMMLQHPQGAERERERKRVREWKNANQQTGCRARNKSTTKSHPVNFVFTYTFFPLVSVLWSRLCLQQKSPVHIRFHHHIRPCASNDTVYTASNIVCSVRARVFSLPLSQSLSLSVVNQYRFQRSC